MSGPSSDGVVSSSQLSGERVSHREASGMPEIMGGEGVGDGGGGDGGGNGVGGDGGGEGCANDCNAVSSSSMTPAVAESMRLVTGGAPTTIAIQMEWHTNVSSEICSFTS